MVCFVVGIGGLHSHDLYNWAKSLVSGFDFTAVLSDCRIRNGENGIHFLLNRDGKRRGDALIEMESEQDVQKALEKHRMYMGQRYVEGAWNRALAFVSRTSACTSEGSFIWSLAVMKEIGITDPPFYRAWKWNFAEIISFSYL